MPVRIQLQHSAKTGQYRCQLIAADGTVLSTGAPAADPAAAEANVLQAPDAVSGYCSGLRPLVDRYKKHKPKRA